MGEAGFFADDIFWVFASGVNNRLPSTPFTPGNAPPSGGSLIAAQARDGRIFIVNEDLTTPLHVTALLSTTATSVIAHKLTVNGNTASLSQGWSLSGLQAPLAPIIVNGVDFITSSGEAVPAAGANQTEAQRIANSKPAVLYAVDAVTGAKLWDSGKTITSFVPTRRRYGAVWARCSSARMTTPSTPSARTWSVIPTSRQ